MKADNPLLKKYGPLPGWAWLAVAGIVGFAVYRWSKGGEESGVEEGYFPTQGIPFEGEEAPAGGGGGIAGLAGSIAELETAGFVPRGSEEARGEPQEPQFGALEGLLEEGFSAWLSSMLTPAGRKAKKQAGRKGAKGKAGKGGKGKSGKGAGKGGKGKTGGGKKGSREVTHAKNPNEATHVANPDHRGSSPPRSRGVHHAAGGTSAGGGGHKAKAKKPAKKKAKGRR